MQNQIKAAHHCALHQRNFHATMAWLAFAIVAFCTSNSFAGEVSDPKPKPISKPNVLIITVDDMSCDSIGAFGCKLAETTPNIDQFATQSLRYEHAHVQVGNCMPSRNVLFSGLYPHNNGKEGFYAIDKPEYPVMADLMKAEGYFVAIRGKVTHSTPYYPYPAWDTDLTILDGKKQDMKNADSYYASTKTGIAMAKQQKKPFCLNINISDPHKPFYAMGKKGDVVPDKNVPSKVFTPEEIPIPGFLFEDGDVRKELAHYYSSVRRADDCFGATMKALRESGEFENTVVVFLSDHGMPLPFAKTALYHHSTRTPLIIHWPGVTAAGAVDQEHMVSAVDFMPTLLEIVGASPLKQTDGRSFAATIRGEAQAGRDAVFKVYNENAGGNRHPMRGIQTKQFGYLFNPWADGENSFATATKGTMTYRQMQKLAETNTEIAARLDLFDHRIVEEFYDYRNDPDGLNNLIDDPSYQEVIQQHRERMLSMMKESNDHAVDVFMNRSDPAARAAYMTKVNAEAKARRANRRKGKSNNESDSKNRSKEKKGSAGRPNRKPDKSLFTMKLPESVRSGTNVSVVIAHKLSTELGEQKFHVTMKDADGNRLDRKVVSAKGRGELEVRFDLPKTYAETGVIFSAFIGEDYQSNLLHLTDGPIPTK
jgi:N-sulfoglucosamine sulfohydrolase